jgi:hypothetical protein
MEGVKKTVKECAKGPVSSFFDRKWGVFAIWRV